ncbi:acyltransferase family protein [Rhodococcoides fascians]|uniref:acyltransferase family protein n=1 Tax=Rhodococcoides fascians TaxID=1828 RepID=UPI0015960514|nr:acyltransferase family protein [Rhodococcus fascians]
MADAVEANGYRSDIQGMRAVAILCVLLYHAGVPLVSGGYVGVDVFFVISGFLITGHLIGQSERQGRIDLTHFYAKRIRRLLPASLLVLVATLALSRWLLPPLAMRDVSIDGVFTAAYLSNVWFAYTGTDYLASNTPSVFQHYWSLALEEQFYIVWPLLIMLVFSIWGSRRLLIIVLSAVSLASFGLGLYFTNVNQPVAFFTLPTRAWELGVGGVIAASLYTGARIGPRTGGFLSWTGFLLVVAAVFAFDDGTVFPGYVAVVPVVGAAGMLIGGARVTTDGLSRLLSYRPFQFFGRISYSLYLWHWPILIIPSLYRSESPAWLRVLLCSAAIVLAALTERFVERPFRYKRGERARPTRSFALGFAATVAVVSLALGAGVMPRLATDRVAGGWPVDAFPADVSVGVSVPTNIRPTLEHARDSNPEIYSDGCHLDYADAAPKVCQFGDEGSDDTVVLFGDSHAAQWFPAFDEMGDNDRFRLVPLTKSACPSVDIATWNSRLQVPYVACDQWREEAFRVIDRLRPSLIVLSNYPHQATAQAGDLETQWSDGLRRTIERMPAGSEVVVLGDGPMFKVEPSMCLSEHLESVGDCSRPVAEVVNATRMQSDERGVGGTKARFIDTREWYCPDGVCAVQRGDIALYRDAHHITVEFSKALIPVLRAALSSWLPSRGNS